MIRPFRVLVIIALATIVALPEGLSAQDAHTSHPLLGEIAELNREGKYAESVEVAREYLDIVTADPDSKAFVVANAERLLAKLIRITEMSPSDQEELSQADHLYDSMMANLYQGEYGAGVEDAKARTEILRRYFGDDDWEVADAINDLAALLGGVGNYVAAEPLYRRAIATYRKAYGAEHPQIANSLNNLAYLLNVQGDYAGAEPLASEALAMWYETLGDEATPIALCLANLGTIYMGLGDYAAAEPALQKSLEMNRKLFGEEHQRVAISLDTLARLKEAQGEYAAAEVLCREALEMRRAQGIVFADGPARRPALVAGSGLDVWTGTLQERLSNIPYANLCADPSVPAFLTNGSRTSATRSTSVTEL